MGAQLRRLAEPPAPVRRQQRRATCVDSYSVQYIIETQEYGRFYLKKRMSFGLHKWTFLKALDGIRQRATLRLS